MSVSSIFNSTTGKIYEELIPQGGGVPLGKGQLLSALANGTEVAVPVGANGSVLSCDSNQDDGLQWIAIPQAIPIQHGQLLSANLGGDTTIVPAPQLPAQANWVLSADATAPTNLLWKPVTGGGGIIDATAPLIDDATAGTNTISINFGASVGQIPYGNGTAKTGTFTNVPTAGQILGINAGVPAWINAGGSGTIVGIAPITEVAGGGNESQIAIGFGAVVGQIPYGNGTANTGTLTNAPTAGQILGVSAGVPTWIPAGGSGTVTALAPLTEYADGASSKVAIDFVAKGDLVVGGGPQAGGNPIAGVILTAGANDMVLTANSATASGLEWKANGSGSSPIIYRNSLNNQPLQIAKPATANDTMILISDRIYNTGQTQIYNQATIGNPSNALPTQGPPSPPLLVYQYTPASNETLTAYSANIYWFSNSLNGLYWALDVYDSTNTTQLIGGVQREVGDTAGEYFNFTGSSGGLALTGGTTYNFSLVRGGSSGDIFQLAEVVVGFSIQFTGNITVDTTNFTGTASFVNAVGSKFLVQGQSLAGFTSAQLGDFTGQTFISSGDANNWVAVGSMPNAGIAFTA